LCEQAWSVGMVAMPTDILTWVSLFWDGLYPEEQEEPEEWDLSTGLSWRHRVVGGSFVHLVAQL